MTLRQFLSVLADNAGIPVTLKEGETELLTFNIEGYEAVESDILARTVSKVSLLKTGPSVKFVVILEAVTTQGD